jgi:hypothetical protein
VKINSLGTLRNSIYLGLKLLEGRGQALEEHKKDANKNTNNNNRHNMNKKKYLHDLEAKRQHEHNHV